VVLDGPFGCEAMKESCELVDFPRWRSVVVQKSEQRLLFAADMAVEGPCQNRLRAD
jgi:hypothetical protein